MSTTGTAPAAEPPTIATDASAFTSQSTNWTPTAKVSAGVLASALTILIVQFIPAPHTHPWTPAAAGALTQIVTFIVQDMVPDRR